MNHMESATPVHEWAERLRPGDLIRVSYGSRSHYMGAFKLRKNRANGWILYYWDLPNNFYNSSDNNWFEKRLQEGLPATSYIYGYTVKDRVYPAKEWMLTAEQRKYYKKLLKFIKNEY